MRTRHMVQIDVPFIEWGMVNSIMVPVEHELRGVTVSQADRHVHSAVGCMPTCQCRVLALNEHFCRQPCAEPVVGPFNRCCPPLVFLYAICKITSCLIFYSIQPAPKLQRISYKVRNGL